MLTMKRMQGEEKDALLQKAEQEKQSTVAAAKRAVEEAKRLVDEAQAKAAATQGEVPQAAPKAPQEEPAQTPEETPMEKPHRRRRNPLRLNLHKEKPSVESKAAHRPLKRAVCPLPGQPAQGQYPRGTRGGPLSAARFPA